jgi:hypothetical protein
LFPFRHDGVKAFRLDADRAGIQAGAIFQGRHFGFGEIAVEGEFDDAARLGGGVDVPSAGHQMVEAAQGDAVAIEKEDFADAAQIQLISETVLPAYGAMPDGVGRGVYEDFLEVGMALGEDGAIVRAEDDDAAVPGGADQGGDEEAGEAAVKVLARGVEGDGVAEVGRGIHGGWAEEITIRIRIRITKGGALFLETLELFLGGRGFLTPGKRGLRLTGMKTILYEGPLFEQSPFPGAHGRALVRLLLGADFGWSQPAAVCGGPRRKSECADAQH